MRHKDPQGIEFIERHIIWEAEERNKQQRELERKSKSAKHRKH